MPPPSWRKQKPQGQLSQPPNPHLSFLVALLPTSSYLFRALDTVLASALWSPLLSWLLRCRPH